MNGEELNLDYSNLWTGRIEEQRKAEEQAYLVRDMLNDVNEEDKDRFFSALDRSMPTHFGSTDLSQPEAEVYVKSALDIAEKFSEKGIKESLKYLALAEVVIRRHDQFGLESNLESTKSNVFSHLAGSDGYDLTQDEFRDAHRDAIKDLKVIIASEPADRSLEDVGTTLCYY